MSKEIVVNYEEKPCYKIVLEHDFRTLAAKVNELGVQKQQKVCIIADTNTAALYLEEVTTELEKCFDTVVSYVFPAGEAHKNVDTINEIYQKLIEEKFDRKDMLAALGGGVTGDMCGFAAATYLRGIDFIQIPTSLLSQVDSSIGGKTGVDFRQYKNMVGAFYQPKLVYMNLHTLHDLPQEHFYAGLGEILKHGLIKDAEYFHWMEKNHEAIMNKEADVLEEMIYRSCRIKQDVVEHDPKEKGERALLNFGHTIGHAVEKLSDFQLIHGFCVAVGVAAASELSCRRGKITLSDRDYILKTLQAFHLPVKTEITSTQEVLETTKLDKKMESGKVKFILLKEIGSAFIDKTVSDEELLQVIEFIAE